LRHAGIHQATLLKLAASRLMTPRDVLAQPPMDLMEMLDQSMPAGDVRAVAASSAHHCRKVDDHPPSRSMSSLHPVSATIPDPNQLWLAYGDAHICK
jgi:hypothetical protein